MSRHRVLGFLLMKRWVGLNKPHSWNATVIEAYARKRLRSWVKEDLSQSTSTSIKSKDGMITRSWRSPSSLNACAMCAALIERRKQWPDWEVPPRQKDFAKALRVKKCTWTLSDGYKVNWDLQQDVNKMREGLMRLQSRGDEIVRAEYRAI